jgi:hypothetical protein
LEDGTRDPGRIVVFEDRNDIEGRAGELFEYLEHQHVLGETQPLTVGELLFHLTAEMIECAMHGLLLRYVEQLGVYRTAPIVKVAPVVLLRSRYGAWLQIESSPKDYELPHEESELNRHLAEVQQAATQLLAEVNSQLKSVVQVIPLLKHYGDDEFSAFPGVRDRGRDKFLLTTGSRTHYLSPTPSIPDCPYHDWAVCNRAGVPSNPGPISIRSTLPRSFFMSLERHHCAHRDVSTAKATPISAANQASCGPRSGRFGQAFCEIWRFEQHLCCRSCVFEEVCLKAPAFQLLCARNVEAAASTETAASGC